MPSPLTRRSFLAGAALARAETRAPNILVLLSDDPRPDREGGLPVAVAKAKGRSGRRPRHFGDRANGSPPSRLGLGGRSAARE